MIKYICKCGKVTELPEPQYTKSIKCECGLDAWEDGIDLSESPAPLEGIF